MNPNPEKIIIRENDEPFARETTKRAFPAKKRNPEQFMENHCFYLSTISADAADTARRYGLGLEIAEYCTACNMDERFSETDQAVREKFSEIARVTLHAPFNELFPCAIDPRARALAADRFREAIALAKGYGAEKIVIHGGYNPQMYYPCWYTEQSALFWKDFLREDPGVDIVLENVLEEEPEYLLDIVRSADHPRLGLCLDIGHVNAYSAVPVIEWLKRFAPYLRHFHLHNNDGSFDAHAPLDEGSIPMKKFLQRALALCPAATFTLELQEDTARGARWLLDNGFITKETNT